MEKLVQNKGKLLITIVKIESYVAYPNLGMSVKVFIWIFYLNVDLGLRRCTCKALQMLEFPFDHACAIIRMMEQDIYEYIDVCCKLPMHEQTYSSFIWTSITHDM